MIDTALPVHKKLITKFLAISTVLVFGPLLALHFVTTNFWTDVLKQSLEMEIKATTTVMASNLDSFLHQVELKTRVLTQADVFESHNSAKIQSYLIEVLAESPDLNSVIYTDLIGRVLSQAKSSYEKGEIYKSAKIEQVREGRQGDVFIFAPGDVMIEPKITYAAPVTDDSNTLIIGLLFIEINLTQLSFIITKQINRINTRNDITIVDLHGKVVVSTDPNLSFQSTMSSMPIVSDNFIKQQTQIYQYKGKSNTDLMTGIAKLDKQGANNAFSWLIMNIAHADIINDPIDKANKIIVIIMLVAIGITLIAIVILNYRLVQPIVSYISLARRIAAGELPAHADIRDDDEIGVLGKSIYQISENIKDQQARLSRSQRLEAVGQLTGGVSHDFNNLLGVIIGDLDLLKEYVANDKAASELLDDALGAALRGGDLNQRLLAFARQQILQPELIQIDEALAEMCRLMERTLGERMNVTYQGAEGVWPVLADRAQVEAAILNLGVNARDAMPEGGRLTLEAGNIQLDETHVASHSDIPPGDYVALSVSDVGIGMPPEVVAHAFEPFFTTKETGAGSGLGLSMVQGFMEQSGGYVSIYSEPRIGSTVKLYFPRATAVPSAAAKNEDVAEMPRGAGQWVLVVEDNVAVREVAVRQLRALGYETIEASTGKEALDLLDAGAGVDLVFSDVVMPGDVSGIDLVRAVRAGHLETPIVLASGFTGAVKTDDQELLSGITLLTKPYRMADLATAVQKAMEATNKTEDGDLT